ncbi:MAG: PTS sugar transporter subunit IIC [Christensenellaceae bacterium]|jgi:uncharacterized membrane protein|nr:PTS sugar transporter subunit IIC [Christensenellaceae bacterium]
MKDTIKKGYERYLVKAMGSMAFGLFCSVIISVVIEQFSNISFLSFLKPMAAMAASKEAAGAAIGVAIAHGLGTKRLSMFASAISGALGYVAGGPVSAFVCAVLGAEAGRFVEGKTPIDIALVPFVVIIVGGVAANIVGPPILAFMKALGSFINTAATLNPVLSGIIISSVMGLVLVSPLSSAALAISLELSGLAAGASVIGCCVQMVGFAVISFKENGWGGVLAQGIGTAKLQLPNAMRHPAILLPTTIASAILGPISSAVFGMTNNAMGAGMGSCSFVGQFCAWQTMSGSMQPGVLLFQIILMHFVLPALLSWGLYLCIKKTGWLKAGYMKLDL